MATSRAGNVNWANILLVVIGVINGVFVLVITMIAGWVDSVQDDAKTDREVNQQFREKHIQSISTINEALVALEKRVQANTKEHDDRYSGGELDSKFDNVQLQLDTLGSQIEDMRHIQRRNEDWMVKLDNRQDRQENLIQLLQQKINTRDP